MVTTLVLIYSLGVTLNTILNTWIGLPPFLGPRPKTTKPHKYKMKVFGHIVKYYSVVRYEYSRVSVIDKNQLLFFIPFTFALGVPGYKESKTTYGYWFEEDVNKLSEDFCLKDYYETKHENNLEEVRQRQKKEQKLRDKINKFNSNEC